MMFLKIEMTVSSPDQARTHLKALLNMIPDEAPEYHPGCYTSDDGGSSFGRWMESEEICRNLDGAGPESVPGVSGCKTGRVQSGGENPPVSSDHIPLLMRKPTIEEVHSACLSYRHDYGLMNDEDSAQLQFEAREWLHAWAKVEWSNASYSQGGAE